MFCWRPASPKHFTNALATVELLVQIDCKGCENRLRKAISDTDDMHVYKRVQTMEIDLDSQKVTVTGYLDQREVLKAVRRTGRKAEFWPNPYDSLYHPFAAKYLDSSTYELTLTTMSTETTEACKGVYCRTCLTQRS